MPVTVTGTWGKNSIDTYNDGIDTYMYGSTPTTNYSDVTYINTGQSSVGADAKFYSLLRFSPSSQIPYMSDIQDARLKIYCSSNDKYPTVYVYRILQPWVSDEVTWDKFNYSVLWNLAGARAADDLGEDDGIYDRHATYVGTDDFSVGTWAEINVTSLVQQWVNKDIKEYGLIVIGRTSSSSSTTSEFVSSRGVDGFRPYLQIIYNLKYHFTGTVLDQGVPASGVTLVAHKRDTFEPMGYTTTSGDGSYDLITTYSGSQYLVCLDKSGGVQYNDKILGLMIPEEF